MSHSSFTRSHFSSSCKILDGWSALTLLVLIGKLPVALTLLAIMATQSVIKCSGVSSLDLQKRQAADTIWVYVLAFI